VRVGGVCRLLRRLAGKADFGPLRLTRHFCKWHEDGPEYLKPVPGYSTGQATSD
jgi:hypothetical protein